MVKRWFHEWRTGKRTKEQKANEIVLAIQVIKNYMEQDSFIMLPDGEYGKQENALYRFLNDQEDALISLGYQLKWDMKGSSVSMAGTYFIEKVSE